MTDQQKRLVSLDVFRGMTIALMILVNTPGTWAHVYAPLRHAKWHGCTLTDLVFPFFLFIVGVAMRFSFRRYDFTLSPELTRKILGRVMTIFLFGLLLSAYPFVRQDWDWSSFRIMGVLQRIGLAYGCAAFLILVLNRSQIITVSGILLVAYWFILWIFGWIKGVDPYALETNLPRMVDLAILGEPHLYMGTGIPFDPEGLLSTTPAVVTVLIGYFTGIILQEKRDGMERVKYIVKAGAVVAVTGWLWGFLFPVNKQLWTSSYVLYTGGLAMLILAVCVWAVDLKGYKKPARPFIIFGTNSIFLFVASGLWVKTILKVKFTLGERTVSGYTYLYQTVFQPLAGDLNGSLLFALFHVGMWWLVLYWMYRKKIFIKI